MSILDGIRVASAGVELFASELESQDAAVTRVDWRPPAAGSESPLARLAGAATAAANDRAVARMQDAHPRLTGIGVAGDLIADLEPGTFLHAGPPIEWSDMAGPLRGAIIGAALLENLATDPDDAMKRAADGRVPLHPLPRARHGRTDGRRRESVDAGVDRRQRTGRQPRSLHLERGSREGPALRRVRRRSDRASPVDVGRPCPGAYFRAPAPRRAARSPGVDRPLVADGG